MEILKPVGVDISSHSRERFDAKKTKGAHFLKANKTGATDTDNLNRNKIYENMKKNDKFIGDVLAPFEQSFGIKFNKFDKPEDPKYVEPKKKANLKHKLKQAERKQEKLKKMDPEQVKQIRWKKVIDKAQGIKDKDDPKIIKKVIKRKDSEKKRHKKKWAERVEKQEEAKSMKEKRKKERIQKSKDNKGKKGKKGAKKR